MSARLVLEDVRIAYGGVEAVRGVSFAVEAGQMACLLGPSGCGKTSLLRAVAGFEPVCAGRVLIGGEEVSRPGFTRRPEQRHIGVVFQDYALFPHCTAQENIAYGLRALDAPERRRRVAEWLERVGLTGEAGRYPHELSGGQQQRIALARALAPEPSLLLIDEPFSSLDASLRERLAQELRDLLKAAGATCLLVTHDQQEAFALADVIGVLGDGRLHQWADAETLYTCPADRFVAEFIGPGALLDGVVGEDGWVQTLPGEAGRLDAVVASGARVTVVARPHQVRIAREGPPNATVERRIFRGADALFALRLDDGARVLALAAWDDHYAEGTRVRAVLEGWGARLLD